ncbi:MAG: hypothetical protein JWM76_3018, partial [Pseudonocardiales bacterium]|nr:hypothetical protein [Pseudonocardiales bacterium]
RSGLGKTGTGQPISVADVLARAGDARIIPVILNPDGALIAMGHGQRFATPTQSLALAARDGGCSAPGCPAPPDQCQVHHTREWRRRKRTSIDHLALVCLFHHLIAIPAGWTVDMINGLPHWIPPAWIDPTQTPIRNTTHHLERTIFTPPVAETTAA